VADRFTREVPGARVHVVVSDVADGDLAVPAAAATATSPATAATSPGTPAGQSPAEEHLERRRAALAPLRWTWLRQVHGARVVTVARPGEHAGEEADASVTAAAGAVLAVQVADCAPVLLWGEAPSGVVVAAAHAGWRGLLAGVLPATVGAMSALGATGLHWTLGPCISPAAYEFGEGDLDAVAASLGPSVRARTAQGAPALDVRAAVAASLAAAGVTAPAEGPPPACTATSGRHFSHRARGDTARQAAVIWWEAT
jgi:hypothetical protein